MSRSSDANSPSWPAGSATAALRKPWRKAFLRIAVENMANAIKRISIERGHDVTDYALNCFGGAGGQHACAVADALGIETVLIHPFAGVLSAYGMGLADIRVLRETAVEAPLADIERAEAAFQRLEALAWEEMAAQGVPPERVEALPPPACAL